MAPNFFGSDIIRLHNHITFVGIKVITLVPFGTYLYFTRTFGNNCSYPILLLGVISYLEQTFLGDGTGREVLNGEGLKGEVVPIEGATVLRHNWGNSISYIIFIYYVIIPTLKPD